MKYNAKIYIPTAYLFLVLITVLFWQTTRDLNYPDDSSYLSELSHHSLSLSVASQTSIFYKITDLLSLFTSATGANLYRIVLFINIINLSITFVLQVRLLRSISSLKKYRILLSSFLTLSYILPYYVIQIRSSFASSVALMALYAAFSLKKSNLFLFATILASIFIHTVAFPIVLAYFISIIANSDNRITNLVPSPRLYLALPFSITGFLSAKHLLDNSNFLQAFSTYDPNVHQNFSAINALIALLSIYITAYCFINNSYSAFPSPSFDSQFIIMFTFISFYIASFIVGLSVVVPLAQRLLVPFQLFYIPIAFSQTVFSPISLRRNCPFYFLVLLIIVSIPHRLSILF